MKRVRVVLAAVLGLLLPAALAAPAAAAPAVPDLGSAIDPYGAYTVESGCSQTEKPGVARLRDVIAATYPGATNILRACTTRDSGHEEGRALDWMRRASTATERAQVEDFLGWLLATDRYGNRHSLARRTGIMYLVWNNKMWRAYRPADGWQPQMLTVGGVKRDCATLGSTYATACHRDHLHISLTWEGARAETSYYRAGASCESRPGCPVRRVTGTDRYALSVAAGRLAAPTARTVVIASGWSSGRPEAVAAGVLARQLGAPLLLTSPNTVPSSVRADIAARGATRAYVVGSVTTVPAAVVDGLRALGVTSITRYGNTDRYGVAAQVALRSPTPGEPVIIASGADAALSEALVAAGAAAATGRPLVLVGPDGIPAATRTALATLAPGSATVVGSVADPVVAEVDALVPTVARVTGADGGQLAARVALAFAPAAASRNPVLASDAAAARAELLVATGRGGLALLTPATTLHASAAYWLTRNAAAIDAATVVGGTASVGTAVVDAVAARIG